MSYSAAGANVRVLMVFDDQTSALLAQEQFLLQRASWIDAEPGSRVSFVAFSASRRVATTEAR
jgi:hypothetical protein